MQEFSSLKELYLLLIPAFDVKLRMLSYDNHSYIKKEDIWQYLSKSKWKNSINLTLSQMVSDIINVSSVNLDNYTKERSR